VEAVPVVQRFGPLEDEVRVAHSRGHAAGSAPVAIYARSGSTPELVVVTRDATGQLRSASWALRPAEDPRRTESAPRRLARGGLGAGGPGDDAGAAVVVAENVGGPKRVSRFPFPAPRHRARPATLAPRR
jgi:hypothetical protein